MTQDASFPEQTDLLEKLAVATEGETSNEQVIDVINAFLNSQVVFPSVDEASEDGAVSPLMLQDTRLCRCLLHLRVSQKILPNRLHTSALFLDLPLSSQLRTLASLSILVPTINSAYRKSRLARFVTRFSLRWNKSKPASIFRPRSRVTV